MPLSNVQLDDVITVLSSLKERGDAMPHWRGRKGWNKAADLGALDYVTGAMVAMRTCGNTGLTNYFSNMVWLCSVRGMFEMMHTLQTLQTERSKRQESEAA